MKLQTFIFNWPGKKQHAAILEAMFRPHCETTVINSDDRLRAAHPHWQHIGNEAYFTDQWNAAIDCFDGDILVHIQADVWPVRVGRVLAEALKYIKNGAGVYAPNVDYNAHYYRKSALSEVDAGVFEVPATDCCFWAIRSEVLRAAPRVDPRINKLGWGIEYLIGAVARGQGLKLLRDYRFTAGHEKGSGYNLTQAFEEWQALRNSVPTNLRNGMKSVEDEREKLLVRRPAPGTVARYVSAACDRARRVGIILQGRAEALGLKVAKPVSD